jgi:predicted DNA-binding transcriptional regulator AlpA
MRHTLMGTKEVAQLLGITRQRVDKISHTHDAFPKPIGVLAGGRIWTKGAIVKWARRARPSAFKRTR